MASSQKKVIVRRFVGDLLAGYLPPSGFVQRTSATPTLSLLDLGGRLLPLPLHDVKTVCYVRDFNLGDTRDPERLTRRSFLARPRSEGLWLRLSFRSGDQLEGLAPLDLNLLDGVLEDAGIFLVPPDVRSNTQRLFIPRAALTALELLAVITAPSRRGKPIPPAKELELQDDLFKDLLPLNTRPN